ncbi:metallo proteinase 10 [Gymnopilus junonius]|uniref:Extracellular metalloproteinase n=1 Tax=Gymnopilus junonius TaxID=109634 RepID=A0A9P5NBL3_GYMJU|nr:metallo proteinase 10 [Gymnopilus junonius]
MVFSLTSLLSFSLTLVGLLASSIEAVPWPRYSKHATHGTRSVGKMLSRIETHYPKSYFKTIANTYFAFNVSDEPFPPSLKSSAISFLAYLGVDSKDVIYHSGATSGLTKIAYLKQSINGLPLANAVANLAFHRNQVVSYSSSFVETQNAKIAPTTPTIKWQSVLPQIEQSLQGRYNGIGVTLEYLVQSDGSLVLTHVIQIQNETQGWYEAYVDAHSGRLVAVTDFVAHASYTVIPVTKKSPVDGVETITDPEDVESSPFGWHSIGNGNTTTTSGNNVLSFQGQEPASQTSAVLNFNPTYNVTSSPTVSSNIDAANTNAFFIANTIHDFAYRYGFTEAAFNFQLENFGKGGQERDRVLISVQDASGINNANFATPPDGQPGICRMFIWDFTSPARDGAMTNDILIHELTHGITNRLTGGGTGRCLQTLEAGGLGEGWSDTMADWMSQTSALTADFVIGDYVTNNPGGLRTYPYSVNPSTNPLTYQSLRSLFEIHGNIVFMHLFIDALSVQPCNPTFVQARDAWIQADQNRYNGTNRCTIFKAFASRGLGINADDDYWKSFGRFV